MLPGSADRILSMAERAAENRNDLMRQDTEAEINYRKSGQTLAFLLTVAAFVAAVVFFALGNPYAGTVLLSVPVTMLIRAFLYPGSSDPPPTDV